MGEIVRVYLYDEMMNEVVFKQHELQFQSKYSVTLSAYRRVFNKIPVDNGGLDGLGQPNVIPTDDNLGMLIGVMYEIDDSEIPKLDNIYQHPHEYTRKIMTFQRHDFTPTKGFIYIAPLEKTQLGLKPCKAMMKKFRGAKRSLDMLQFSRLMNTQTCD